MMWIDDRKFVQGGHWCYVYIQHSPLAKLFACLSTFDQVPFLYVLTEMAFIKSVSGEYYSPDLRKIVRADLLAKLHNSS